ncbi:MAG TPA: ribonuclease III domain-containing protein, partial [Bacteroidales bacterium]|nr:ribonuclease III domain-containing protein [Bacteroidales bacterium]
MNIFLFKRKTKEEKELSDILKKITGFRIKNLELFKTALRHSSAAILHNGKLYNNERLEFVGDSILNAIVSDILYIEFPKASEGKLSVLRSLIVNRQSLNKIAEDLHLDDLVIYRNTGNSPMKNLAGNSFEALLGALYFDRGYKSCKTFIKGIISKHFDLRNLLKQTKDYKSKLLQFMQKYKLDIVFNTYENCESNEKNIHFC